MTNFGQAYLDQLSQAPPGSFECCFALVSNKLGLGSELDRNELMLLHEAAYRATCCNLALNGLGPYAGTMSAEHEPVRRGLEAAFLIARDVLFASPGWQALLPRDQLALRSIFLTVLVTPERLARH